MKTSESKNLQASVNLDKTRKVSEEKFEEITFGNKLTTNNYEFEGNSLEEESYHGPESILFKTLSTLSISTKCFN